MQRLSAPKLPTWLNQHLNGFTTRYSVELDGRQMHVMEAGDPNGRPVLSQTGLTQKSTRSTSTEHGLGSSSMGLTSATSSLLAKTGEAQLVTAPWPSVQSGCMAWWCLIRSLVPPSRALSQLLFIALPPCL